MSSKIDVITKRVRHWLCAFAPVPLLLASSLAYAGPGDVGASYTQPLAKGIPVDLLSQQGEDQDRARIQIFEGTGLFLGPKRPGATGVAPEAGDTSLEFEGADIHDVVRAVLGEMLKLPYSIDPQVSGHITLKTGGPISRSAVLPALEISLKMAGAAIITNGGVYDIVPIADAQRRGASITYGSGQDVPGYGIEIVPLKYIAADEMEKILEPLAPQNSLLRVDTQRNLIFLAGTEPERVSLRQTVSLFDVDYLAGMSFALIQPAHIDAGTLAEELDKVFETESSPVSGLVHVIPISRINSLLVVTSRASYLHTVSNWVLRLDVPPVASGERLYYYRLQSAQASQVAQTLAQLYGGVVLPGASTQPGSGIASSSLSPVQSLPSALGQQTMTQQPSNFGQQATLATPINSAGAYPQMLPNNAASSLQTTMQNPNAPQIVTDDANNALIIRADAAEYASIEKIIREMDVTPDQVLVEATIVEVTLNQTLNLGVEWYFQSGNQTYNLSQTGHVKPKFPGFAFTYLVPDVQATISALGALTQITVLSSPKILTLDNKPASLQVGDEVPMVTQTSVSTTDSSAPLVSTVTQRSTGVILSVTPRIGKSGVVYLDVSQEVSDVIPTTTSGIDSPTIQERKIQTTVAVSDGNTVALGGLIRHSDTSGNSGIPYLKDIPVLGNLFSSTNNTHDRTELLIFLTPHVVRSAVDAKTVTDDLTSGMDDVRHAIDSFGQKN